MLVTMCSRQRVTRSLYVARGYYADFPVTIALVDGLHTAEQAYREILNSINGLDTPDIVLVHDCNPVSLDAASPVLCAGKWNGEVWKAIVRLHPERNDLRVCCSIATTASGWYGSKA
jgi:hypothetical protein